MGYPMTYQRVIGRNGLAKGGYDATPDRQWTNSTRVADDVDAATAAILLPTVIEYWTKQTESVNGAWRTLAGDLRRLEADTIDEGTTCQHIAARTGIDVDTVAAVLKEFMSW